MNIEIFAWCSSRELFVTGMTTTLLPNGQPLATLSDAGVLVPADGVIIDEIGQIMKSQPIYDENDNVITPAVIIDGHHVNLCAYGELADMLTSGLPQYDSDGNLLGVFERTHILQLIPGLVWTPIPGPGVPSGYEGPNGVCLFDPASVSNRKRAFL